mgnify:FL=1
MVCANIMHKNIYVGFKLGQNLMGSMSRQKYMGCEGMLSSNFNKDKFDIHLQHCLCIISMFSRRKGTYHYLGKGSLQSNMYTSNIIITTQQFSTTLP